MGADGRRRSRIDGAKGEGFRPAGCRVREDDQVPIHEIKGMLDLELEIG